MPIIKEEEKTRVFVLAINFGAKLTEGDYTQERIDSWAETVHTFTHIFAIKGDKANELKQHFKDSEEFNNIEPSEEFETDFLNSEEFRALTTYNYTHKTFKDLGGMSALLMEMSTVLSSDLTEITEFVDFEKIKDYE